MRIAVTALTRGGPSHVVLTTDESATVGAVAVAIGEATRGGERLAPVIPIQRPHLTPGASPAAQVRPPMLFMEGRALDPSTLASAVLHDGAVVTADPKQAPGTVLTEPEGVVEVRVAGGPGAGRVHRLGVGSATIGSERGSAVRIQRRAMPARAALLTVRPGEVTVAPIDGTPLRLDGSPIEESTAWPAGGLLEVGDAVLTLAAVEPPDAHLSALTDGGLAYNRPPRLLPSPRDTRLEVPVPPKPAEKPRLYLLTAVLPAVLGLVMALAFQQWYFLLFALLSPAMVFGQWWSDRRYGRKSHRTQVKEYEQRKADFEVRLAELQAGDEAARRDAYPDPAEVLLTATGPRRRLWERRRTDPDALRLRVGLADQATEVDLVPERGADHDAELPPAPASRLVPVTFGLADVGVAGLAGERVRSRALAGWLVAQAAVLHSPRDLTIVVLGSDPAAADDWDWVRWLPHTRPREDESCVALVGTDPETAARRATELADLVSARTRSATPAGFGGGRPGVPYDVLVVLDGAGSLRRLPGMPQVLKQGPSVGVYALCLDEAERLLPEECAVVAEVPSSGEGRLRLRGAGLEAIGAVLPDLVAPAWCERTARCLSPVRDTSREDDEGALPGSVRLLDMLRMPDPDADAVAQRWALGPATNVPVGMAADGPFTLDLRMDGPHGLIAGTTGAGKSELLQTLIAGLAVANRPDAMNFVLIDYKGGSAFADCARLPHTVGMVSDLDAHLTQRALDSLSAELRRREEILYAAGAKDIEDYQEARAARMSARARQGRPPVGDAAAPPSLPRLVLIVDEFAALVAELPDFVSGLVGIAQRGRSLGVHMILATQRPAGVVSADIRANTNLRIALRVTDPEESSDIIDVPDASRIPRSAPGRAYVRSGAHSLTAVQSARIGGRRPGAGAMVPVAVTPLSFRALGRPLPSHAVVEEPGDPGETDLQALVEAVSEASRRLGLDRPHSPWLPPLPSVLTLDDLPTPTAFPAESGHEPPALHDAGVGGPGGRSFSTGEAGGGHGLRAAAGAGVGVGDEVAGLPIGLTDLPSEQARRPLTLDLAGGGHLAVAGAARSGRTTLLRTLAGAVAAYTSPADVHLYAIDCGGSALLPLLRLPHCGAVVTREQTERVGRLLARLSAEVTRRQQLLAAQGHAGLAEQRAAAAPEDRLPWMLLLLDRWEGFFAAFENYDYGRLIDAYLHLLREGPGVGLRAVTTGDRSLFRGQISTVFDDRLLLPFADPDDAIAAGIAVRELPSDQPPGRVLRPGPDGPEESQIALLGPAVSASAGPRLVTPPEGVPAARPGPHGAAPAPSPVTPSRGAGSFGHPRQPVPPQGADPSGAGQVAALHALAEASRARYAREPLPNRPLRVDELPARVTLADALALTPYEDAGSGGPLWTVFGVGGDELAPLGVDLSFDGPGFTVAGPPRSGRSTTLITMTRVLLDRGVPVVCVTPRRSPLRDLTGTDGVLDVLGAESSPERLTEAIAGHDRYVVVVDDAELLSDSALGPELDKILVSGRDAEHGMIVAGTTDDLASTYGGFTVTARRSRHGLLLAVRDPADGDLLGVRLPRNLPPGPAGRALFAHHGRTTPVQLALP
ncbi:MAG: cell division protein FtsK [Streptosporangiales bacterium]|nr:cell division protein FtsK [Streptosporangiales bacterium]